MDVTLAPRVSPTRSAADSPRTHGAPGHRNDSRIDLCIDSRSEASSDHNIVSGFSGSGFTGTAGTTQQLTRSRATIRLAALQRNYRKIVQHAPSSDVAVAVKGNGYGLGAVAVGQALWRAGCREFFVAQPDEGIELRAALPHAEIHVLNGLMPGTEADMIENELVPVLLSLRQLQSWQLLTRKLGRALPAGLHIDSGMHRTGLPSNELKQLLAEPHRLEGLQLRHIITHLASADDADSQQPEDQLQRFKRALQQLPQTRASIANSAGIFRNAEFHLDLVRPGIAIYGGNPTPGQTNPMEPAVVLEAPLLQVVNAAAGEHIGYGASYTTPRDARHALVAAGYADGVMRSLSNNGQMAIAGHRCAIVGRVSMDVTTIDVSKVPEHLLYEGAPVEYVGDTIALDDAARAAGTIGYELLTGIGRRFQRVCQHD